MRQWREGEVKGRKEEEAVEAVEGGRRQREEVKGGKRR